MRGAHVNDSNQKNSNERLFINRKFPFFSFKWTALKQVYPILTEAFRFLSGVEKGLVWRGSEIIDSLNGLIPTFLCFENISTPIPSSTVAFDLSDQVGELWGQAGETTTIGHSGVGAIS